MTLERFSSRKNEDFLHKCYLTLAFYNFGIYLCMYKKGAKETIFVQSVKVV